MEQNPNNKPEKEVPENWGIQPTLKGKGLIELTLFDENGKSHGSMVTKGKKWLTMQGMFEAAKIIYNNA